MEIFFAHENGETGFQKKHQKKKQLSIFTGDTIS